MDTEIKQKTVVYYKLSQACYRLIREEDACSVVIEKRDGKDALGAWRWVEHSQERIGSHILYIVCAMEGPRRDEGPLYVWGNNPDL